MRVQFHPEFARDVVRFASQYKVISLKLEARFRMEVEDALKRVKSAPTSAGHFLNTGSAVTTDVRRRNLESFPYFVLYGIVPELIVFGAPHSHSIRSAHLARSVFQS